MILTEQEKTWVKRNHILSVNAGCCLNKLSINPTNEHALVYAANTDCAYLLPMGSFGQSSSAWAKNPRCM